MESRLGHDFRDVRVHSDSAADASARSVNANAYTVGSHVVFQRSAFDPGSHAGRTTLAHELTHVVQQTQGPSYKADGGIDTSGEAEANAVESAVAAGKPAHTALRSVPSGGGPGLKKIGSGPQLRKRGPALEGGGEGGSKFCMGMTFSLEGF